MMTLFKRWWLFCLLVSMTVEASPESALQQYQRWLTQAPHKGEFSEIRHDALLGIAHQFKGGFEAKENEVSLVYRNPPVGRLHYTGDRLHIQLPDKQHTVELGDAPEAGLLFQIISALFNGDLIRLEQLAAYQLVSADGTWRMILRPGMQSWSVSQILLEPQKGGGAVLTIEHDQGDWRKIQLMRGQ